MQRTICKTPIISTVLRWLAELSLWLWGWRIEGQLPKIDKYILIAAPHTSNWDFVIGIMGILKLRANIHWMGKHTLFPFPFGGFMRWLGGIPIDRRRAGNVVSQMIENYEQADELSIVITPEGTRSKVDSWKTGFYHIAVGAEVPIVMVVIDGDRKVATLKEMFEPTGDLAVDMEYIQSVYAGVRGIRPEKT